MADFSRYAIYYAPPAGPLAEFGARWLGWDPVTGRTCAYPEVAGLPCAVAELTATPHKYGFHGTLKPPFRLAPGTEAGRLIVALDALAADLAQLALEGLALRRIDGFLALTPRGDTSALARLAAEVVERLHRFRAPVPEAELARRRGKGLSPRQEALLMRWGYPYVMEDFRFHLTLTGSLAPETAAMTEAALAPLLAPILPEPFEVRELCLFGEAEDRRFHEVYRSALSG